MSRVVPMPGVLLTHANPEEVMAKVPRDASGVVVIYTDADGIAYHHSYLGDCEINYMLDVVKQQILKGGNI